MSCPYGRLMLVAARAAVSGHPLFSQVPKPAALSILEHAPKVISSQPRNIHPDGFLRECRFRRRITIAGSNATVYIWPNEILSCPIDRGSFAAVIRATKSGTHDKPLGWT